MAEERSESLPEALRWFSLVACPVVSVVTWAYMLDLLGDAPSFDLPAAARALLLLLGAQAAVAALGRGARHRSDELFMHLTRHTLLVMGGAALLAGAAVVFGGGTADNAGAVLESSVYCVLGSLVGRALVIGCWWARHVVLVAALLALGASSVIAALGLYGRLELSTGQALACATAAVIAHLVLSTPVLFRPRTIEESEFESVVVSLASVLSLAFLVAIVYPLFTLHRDASVYSSSFVHLMQGVLVYAVTMVTLTCASRREKARAAPVVEPAPLRGVHPSPSRATSTTSVGGVRRSEALALFKVGIPWVSADLMSAGFHGVTRGGKVEYGRVAAAVCVFDPNHAPPVRGCECGHHAYRDQAAAYAELASDARNHPGLMLEVSATGRYVLYQRGARYARQEITRVVVQSCAAHGCLGEAEVFVLSAGDRNRLHPGRRCRRHLLEAGATQTLSFAALGQLLGAPVRSSFGGSGLTDEEITSLMAARGLISG